MKLNWIVVLLLAFLVFEVGGLLLMMLTAD